MDAMITFVTLCLCIRLALFRSSTAFGPRPLWSSAAPTCMFLGICMLPLSPTRRCSDRSPRLAPLRLDPLGSHSLASVPPLGLQSKPTQLGLLRIGFTWDRNPRIGLPRIGTSRIRPLASDPSPAPLLVIWSSAALVLGAWPLWSLWCSSCSFVQPSTAPVLGRSDPRLLRSSVAPALGHSVTP